MLRKEVIYFWRELQHCPPCRSRLMYRVELQRFILELKMFLKSIALLMLQRVLVDP